MAGQGPPTVHKVRFTLLAAFGEIAAKTGLDPTHLDMWLRLEDGTEIRAEYKPLAEGGSGQIDIRLEPAQS